MPRVDKNNWCYIDTEKKQFRNNVINGYDLMFRTPWRTISVPIDEVIPENFYIYNRVIRSEKGTVYTLIKYLDPVSDHLVNLEIELPKGFYKIEPHKFIEGCYQLKKTFYIDYLSNDDRILEKFEKIHKAYVKLLLNHRVLNKNGFNKDTIAHEIFPISRFVYQRDDSYWFNLYANITERTQISHYDSDGQLRATNRIIEGAIGVEGIVQTIDISFVSLSRAGDDLIYNRVCVSRLEIKDL